MGAWIETLPAIGIHSHLLVAPHVGAWIETYQLAPAVYNQASLPKWERGLKHRIVVQVANKGQVAPHVGAWIETLMISSSFKLQKVAPHVGAL